MPDASIKGIDFVIKGNADSASNSIKKLIDRMNELNGTFKSSSGISRLSGAFQTMKKDISAALKPMQKLGAAFKRIVFYRAIRFAIKQVTEAFQVGLQNAYQFSKAVGYDLADSLDNIATKSLTMKNQMGAAFGGLIQAIEPIVLRLIALVTRAANAIAQLMAILGGKSTYLKAVDTMTEWGEAVGGAGAAAKEALKYLAPFDELNVLPDDKNGGGGGGGGVPDYSAMFEETAVSQALQDFVSDFKITVSDVLFDWSDLTGEQIAEKALAGLFALTGAGVGFILGGVPGAIVGSLVGLSLGLVADTLVFDHDGVLSTEEIAHSLQYVLNALAGGVVGFVVGGPGGALIGASIGLGISLVADIFDFKAAAENKNSNWLNQLTVALTTLSGGVIGFMVGGPAGALIGATIGFGVSAVVESIQFSSSAGSFWGGAEYFVTEVLGLPTDAQWIEWGENIWKNISEGVSSGWHWLTDGFADIGTELYNIFIAPIVNTFNDFISAHPKIASFFGLSGESLSPNFSSSGSDTMSLDIEANVISVKDNIPSDKRTIGDMIAGLKDKIDNIPVVKKTIDGIKGIFGSTDNGKSLSTADKQIPAQAKLTTFIKKFTGSNLTAAGSPQINSQSVLTSYIKDFGSGSPHTAAGSPKLNTQSVLTSYVKDFGSGSPHTASGAPKLNTQANLNSYIKDFGSGYPHTASGALKLNTQAALTSYIKDFGSSYPTTSSGAPKLNSQANLTSYLDNVDPVLAAVANFIKGWWDTYYAAPTIDATAKITSAYKDPAFYPTIDVKAHIVGTGGNYTMASGGAYYGNTWHKIPQAASGGKFHGTLFWAGENGAEIVGHAGGRTEVLNRSQLAATMYAAVKSAMSGIAFNVSAPSMATGSSDEGANEDMLYRAFLRALNDADNDITVDLDGNAIYKSVVKHNRQERMRTGMNPMLSY